MRAELYKPESYKAATIGQLKKACNGCGSKGFGGFIIPDTIYGLNITECCNIHDWMYNEGKTIQDKGIADRAFLNNMMRSIECGSGWLRWLRRERAAKYYYAVKLFGGGAYWNGKNNKQGKTK